MKAHNPHPKAQWVHFRMAASSLLVALPVVRARRRGLLVATHHISKAGEIHITSFGHGGISPPINGVRVRPACARAAHCACDLCREYGARAYRPV
ncbi:hypothetical protein FHX58_006249 [Paraburkholderia tropica]|nr:hypothetical protein [Paraburkholderia tropica]